MQTIAKVFLLNREQTGAKKEEISVLPGNGVLKILHFFEIISLTFFPLVT